jgi:hypothetical protein
MRSSHFATSHMSSDGDFSLSSELISSKKSWSCKTLRHNALDIDVRRFREMRTPHLQEDEAATDRRVEAYDTLTLIALNEEPG